MTLPDYDPSIGGIDMSSQRYTPEFKDEAVRQIVDRGYSVADVSERLGVSVHSLCKWVKAIRSDEDLGPANDTFQALHRSEQRIQGICS
jgi:transposase-like protein